MREPPQDSRLRTYLIHIQQAIDRIHEARPSSRPPQALL